MIENMISQITNRVSHTRDEYIVSEIKKLFGIDVFKEGSELTEKFLEIVPLLEFEKIKVSNLVTSESCYTLEVPLPEFTEESIKHVKEYLKSEKSSNYLEIIVSEKNSLPKIFVKGKEVEVNENAIVGYRCKTNEQLNTGVHSLLIEKILRRQY